MNSSTQVGRSRAFPRPRSERRSDRALLARIFARPEQASALTLADWDLVVRQARAESLQGRLAFALRAAGLFDAVPDAPRRHLLWAETLARKHAQDAAREVEWIRAALAPSGIAPVLLKGAAYLLAELPTAQGRLFGDTDILVPRERLRDAERAAVIAGWRSENLDPYDQRYYRKWMHELPPMRHLGRGTIMDIHHTILPVTAKPRIDPTRMLAAARELPKLPGVHVLSPEDMVLHATVHLFFDGDMRQGLRELVDLDSLIRYFAGRDREFWSRLTRRAEQLDLGRSLWYATTYCRSVLQTPVPDWALDALTDWAPGPPVRALMDLLLRRGLRPNHPSCDGPDVRLGRLLLYVRSHYLRMPLRLLLPHLARKAVRGMARRTDAPA